MPRRLKRTKFKNLDINDKFFDSLKAGYKAGFEEWFIAKSEENLYVVVDDAEELSGMVYLKNEKGVISDITPKLPSKNWLKVGTFKIDSRGTRLGERVIKKIFDTAIAENSDAVYVTVFEIHQHLIKLFKRYGFKEWGTKTTKNGIEKVYVRDLSVISNDLLLDYPFMQTNGRKFWLLAIKPKWHTELLPDSILKNEPKEMVQDVSHTNTIHKVYISHVSLAKVSKGDAIVFYRTADKSPAHYRSVATSVCIVEEIKTRKSFKDEAAFLTYCRPRSVYSIDELKSEWKNSKTISVIKMTYNAAFNKRLTRGKLIDEIGMRTTYWVLLNLSTDQFRKVIDLGEIDARLIVN